MASKMALFWNDTHQLFSYFLRKSHFFLHIFKNCWPKLFFWSSYSIKTHEILQKTALFSRSEFFISKNTVKVGFGYENSSFFGMWIFYFRKSVLAAKKAVFWEEIRKLRAKIIFLVSYKNSWNSTKTALFLNLNFLFPKIQWKSVLATKTAVFSTCIWILYFRKNKMKVSFGCEKSSFWEKYGNCCAKFLFLWTIKTHEILRKQHFF